MKYKVNQGFIIQKMGRNIAIFDGEKSVLYNFNETAHFIFSKIKLGFEEEQIIGALVKKFNINFNKARTDLKVLLKDLLKSGIISQTEPKKST